MSDGLAAPYGLGPGESRWQVQLGPLALRMRARGADTGGRFTFWEYDAPAGWAGPPLHIHRDLDEATQVLSGELLVRTGDTDHTLEAGGFVWMPRDVPHGFANVSSQPTRFVGIATPPGQLEEMFEAIAAYVSDLAGPEDVDPQRMAEINAEHGVEIVGPPLGAAGSA